MTTDEMLTEARERYKRGVMEVRLRTLIDLHQPDHRQLPRQDFVLVQDFKPPRMMSHCRECGRMFPCHSLLIAEGRI